MSIRKNLLAPPAVAVLILLSFLAAGCSKKSGHSIPNEKPFVKITGGPLEGSRQSYTARVYWTGWDYDGIVDHYEYAIDPPTIVDGDTVFSEAEIARPDSFPDINIRIIPGPTEKQDTLVVSKVVHGKSFSFLWIKTTDFSHSFAFSTDIPDSANNGSQLIPTDEFHGVHRIYVRCEDNDGLYSDIGADSKLAYTASTLCPSSEITKPILGGILNVGPTVTVTWDGTDADSPDPKKKPTGYFYKLLNLTQLNGAPRLDGVPASFLYTRPDSNRGDKGDPAWHFQSADTLKRTFFLTPGTQYAFGVRAQDVAGAVEPFLDFDRNAFKFQSLPKAGTPELTICEPSLGCLPTNTPFTGTTRPPEEVQVPVGAKLKFSWSADAEAYGGTIDGFSWGIDIPDLDRDGPGSGWSGWGKTLNVPAPIIFNSPSTHVFYVRVRDSSGTITIGSILLHVVDFALDRQVLFVDDFKNESSPYYLSSDASVDAWYKDLFDNSGRFPATSTVDSLWTYEAYGLNDVAHLPPIPPDLDYIGRFQLIVWYANFGYGGQSAMYDVTSYKNRHLGAYLSAGGKLWVIGEQTVGTMMRNAGQNSAPNSYPLAPEAGDFAYDYMKLASSRIENALASGRTGGDKTSPSDNMIGAAPYPWPPSDTTKTGEPRHVNPYPPADQDSTRWNPFAKAMVFGDAIFDPIYAQDIPGFPATGHLDSLYIYKAVKSNSKYNNRLNAVRFYDLNPDRAQGRVQWFGFSLNWIKTSQAQEIFNRTIDWFNEEASPGGAP